jgi:hypothetical protein
MSMYAEIDLSTLEKIVRKVPNISDITRDRNSITFIFMDKDKDNMTVLVNEIDDERIVSLMGMPIPEGHLIASLIGANNWNQRKDAHGTFAYLSNIDDTTCVFIESHLLLRGGVEEENIKLWLKNLVNHINPFEEQVISTLKETGEDSELLQSNGGGIAKTLGTIVGTAFDVWLNSP